MARNLEEARADLERVRSRIVEAENAASYGVAGRTKVNARLELLYAREKELEAQIRAFEGKSRVSYPRFASK